MFNVALEPLLMVDGRDGDDLETQALNAVHTHNEPGREPTPEELAAIAAFQESLFSHAAIRAFLDTGTGLGLPDGTTPSEIRGRVFFAPNRQCGICHSGPMLNQTSEFHTNAVGFRFESASVGVEPDNPNEKFLWCFVDPETNQVVPGPSGDPELFPMPLADPGIALIRGSITFTLPDGTEETVSHEILSSIVGFPMFKIPTLWGTPNTAPYFHDNSAKDFNEVLDHYNNNFFNLPNLPRFRALVGCDPEAPLCLSEQDKADIISYLQLLSFERETPP